MTDGPIEAMNIEELIRDFEDLSKQLGTIFDADLSQEKFQRTPDRLSRLARLKALAAALRERAPPDAIHRIMEDDDADIRGWAALQLRERLPGFANATFIGLLVGKPTAEILNLQRRARTLPPKRPTLREMSDDALVERFEDAATREYATRFVSAGGQPQDIDLCNRIVGEVIDIMREFKRREALARLLPLLESDIITVRAEAARATLTVDPARASKVLEAVVARNDTYELGRASRALALFRQGKIVVWGVG
jgi:HEAT repeat protein